MLRPALLGVSLALALGPSTAVAQTRDILPLKRVRLYEAGVAYFERSGTLGASARLPVPRSHLDDALKSLVILDADGKAAVSGVEMEQPVTEAHSRALAGLPSDSEGSLSFDGYLGSLAGTRVEVTLENGAVRGELVQIMAPEQSGLSRCVRVEPETTPGGKPQPCVSEQQSGLLVMTDAGEVRRIATSDVRGVRPLDPAVQKRLRGAAGARQGAAASEHALTVKLRAASNVTLGYVAEAPLWRASYRLLLGPSGPILQGWALIHNDTDEAWRGVRVELVNGQPDSFLFPLAAPRYATRRLVTPSEHLPSVPQLLDRTADDAWDGGGIMGEGLGLGGIGLTGHGYGSGGLAAAVIGEVESSLLTVGDLAAQDPTQAAAVGALFRYALTQSIDLGAKRSLLVPFLREAVKAERVAWFEGPGKAARSTIVMTNTSSQTMPPGTIALFEGGGFAGESAIDRWEPEVRRLVHFGVDLDVALESKDERKREELRLLRFDGNTLTEHYVRRTERAIHVTNRGTVARSVHLRLDVVNNSKVAGADAVFVDSHADSVAAVFELPATSRKSYELATEEGLERAVLAAKLDAAKLTRLLGEKALPAAQLSVIRRALPHFRKYEALLKKRVDLKARIARLDERLTRLAQTLDIVRRAAEDQGERQAELLVDGEAERDRLKVELDAIAPNPELVAARRELLRLSAK